ncbi:MAG: TetR family transcriptional regulator [Halobacteriales archaeon]|nr:TetR family transcriptional regulator [Halobacteriales archaeon]
MESRRHPRSDDLTTNARIRDAALARFPVDGYVGTTLRAIASDAGVSPALVLHHFGSKEGLRQACDSYVIDAMGRAKMESMRRGTYREAGPVAAAYRLVEPLLRYLAWTLRSGGEAATRIFDDLLDEVTRQLEEGQELGLVNAIDDPRRQAAVLVTMQLGGLILHEHYSRAMGVDTLTADGLVATAPYALRVLSGELFDREVMADAARTMTELNDHDSETEEP